MSNQITVPSGFAVDFKEYCYRMKFDHQEEMDLKNAVRNDFASVGAWVSRQVAILRFADGRWGGLPSADQCDRYLMNKGECYDEDVFKKLGLMLLIGLCYDARLKPDAL